MNRKIIQIIPENPHNKDTQVYQQDRVYGVWGGLVPSMCSNLADFNILITEKEKDMPIYIKEATTQGFVEIDDGSCFDYENPNSLTRRGRKMEDKSNCLMAKQNTDFMRYEGNREITLHGKKVKVLGIRRLTPTECARLQTIPTWYKWECSDSQAYRMLGNGWTVEVIKHFFSFLPKEWF